MLVPDSTLKSKPEAGGAQNDLEGQVNAKQSINQSSVEDGHKNPLNRRHRSDRSSCKYNTLHEYNLQADATQNNPLHISLFPVYATNPADNTTRNDLEYQFMLNSSLDIFEARLAAKPVGQDFGLLHALDERMALYGWCTNTGVKLVVVVDMEGRPAQTAENGGAKGAAAAGAMLGLRSSDLTPVSFLDLVAYVSLARSLTVYSRLFRLSSKPTSTSYATPSTYQTTTIPRNARRRALRLRSRARGSRRKSGVSGRRGIPASRRSE